MGVAAPAATVVAARGVAAPVSAVGPLVGALGLNPAVQRLVKRDADADADAEADPQLLLAPGLVRAPVAAVAGAPAVAVTPRCHQKVERQCRQVPVQTSRTVVVPNCVSVPKCVSVPRPVCNTVSRDVP